MQWSDIGKVLGGIAPTLGGVLLGPMGSAAGQILATALGTDPTPEAVQARLEQGGPEVAAAIAQAESEAAERYKYLAVHVGQAEHVNETIRAELGAGVSWWHWRHLIGYATLLWAVAVLPPLVIALWRTDPASLNAVTTALAGALSWFAILAGLNGFVAQDSTRAKVAALDGKDSGGLIGRAIKTIARK